jgi:hypothetical protein
VFTFLQSVVTISAAPAATLPPPWWDHAKTVAETLKTAAEAFAFASAGGFFLYKLISGYLVVNLDLSLTCERRCSGSRQIDYLAVTAVVKKGDRGAVILHDARARISVPAPGEEHLKKLSSIVRLSFKKSEGILELLEKQSKKSPLLNLSAGEQTTFSTFFRVLADQPFMVEVTVLGNWPWHPKTVYQWRASQVSLPIQGRPQGEKQ